jgi:steroid delta-isomerase-like uncharacterized protein
MTREEITKFFSRRDQVWQQHDSTALAADHTEDGEAESPLHGKIKGRIALRETYAQWFVSFPDARYQTEHLLIDGDRVAQFIKMSGTQQGEFCGLPPTGKKFEIRCAFLFSFQGGRVAHEIRIYDLTGILLQLGVLKAKPAF